MEDSQLCLVDYLNIESVWKSSPHRDIETRVWPALCCWSQDSSYASTFAAPVLPWEYLLCMRVPSWWPSSSQGSPAFVCFSVGSELNEGRIRCQWRGTRARSWHLISVDCPTSCLSSGSCGLSSSFNFKFPPFGMLEASPPFLSPRVHSVPSFSSLHLRLSDSSLTMPLIWLMFCA